MSRNDYACPGTSDLLSSAYLASPSLMASSTLVTIPEQDAPKNITHCYHRTVIARLVGFSLFVDMLVYGILVPILPSIPGIQSDGQLGFLFASYALGLLVSSPVIGYVSDKFNIRKAPMVSGLFGLCITTVLFAFGSQFWHLVLARVLQGFSAGAPWTVGLSVLADIFPSHQLGSVIGPVLSCNHAGFIAGPIIGGCLFQYFGYSSPFYFSAGLAFINLIFWSLVDERHLKSISMNQEEEEPLLGDENTTTQEHISPPPPYSSQIGMIDLLQSTCIQLCVLVIVIVGGIFAGLEPTLPLYLQTTYSLTPSQIGFVFISLIVPAVITATVAGRMSDKFGGPNVLIWGLLSLATVAPIPAIPGLPLWAVVFSLSLLGGVQSFVMTPVIPIMAQYISSRGSKSYASLYALFNLAYSFAILIGPTFGGIFFEQVGFFMLMCIFATCIGVAFIIVACNRHQFVSI